MLALAFGFVVIAVFANIANIAVLHVLRPGVLVLVGWQGRQGLAHRLGFFGPGGRRFIAGSLGRQRRAGI